MRFECLSGADYVMLFSDEERRARMVDELAFVFERGCDFLGRHRSLQSLPIIEPQLRNAVERRLAPPERAMNRVALNVLLRQPGIIPAIGPWMSRQ